MWCNCESRGQRTDCNTAQRSSRYCHTGPRWKDLRLANWDVICPHVYGEFRGAGFGSEARQRASALVSVLKEDPEPEADASSSWLLLRRGIRPLSCSAPGSNSSRFRWESLDLRAVWRRLSWWLLFQSGVYDLGLRGYLSVQSGSLWL